MDIEKTISTILPFIIALFGWIFAWLQSLSHRRQKIREERNTILRRKIETVLDYLNDFGELVSLYRYFARYSGHLEKDEHGNLIADEEGNFIVSESLMDPEPRFEAAIMSLENSDIKGAIALQIVRIRKNSSEVSDLSFEFDPTGGLNKDLGHLYVKSVNHIEQLIKYKNYKQVGAALNEADEARRKIRSTLENLWEVAINNRKPPN